MMSDVVKSLIKSMIINTFMATIKILGGIFGSSNTLITDGVHTLTNLATEFFSILGHKASIKEADKKHPLGYSAIENITIIGIGIVIVFAGIKMIENAFVKENNIPNKWVILIIILCIIIKFFSYKNLQKSGNKLNSDILVTTSTEVKLDLYSSIFTLIVVVISQLNIDSLYIGYVDTIGAIVIAALIIYTGVMIIIDNIGGITYKNEKNSVISNDIKKIINNYKEIDNIDNLLLIKHGDNYQVILSVICNNKISFIKANEIRNKFEKDILDSNSMIKMVVVKMIPKGE